MKKTDISFFFIVLISITLFVGGIWIFFVDIEIQNTPVWFRAVMAFVSAASLFLPRFIFRSSSSHRYLKENALLLLELGWMIILVLNALGAVWFYNTTEYYDMMLHLITPMIGGCMIAVLVSAHQLHYGAYKMRSSIGTTLFLTGLIVVLWEVYEYSTDALLGTNMYGQQGESLDTILDIAGGFIALLFIYFFLSRYLEKYFLHIPKFQK